MNLNEVDLRQCNEKSIGADNFLVKVMTLKIHLFSQYYVKFHFKMYNKNTEYVPF